MQSILIGRHTINYASRRTKTFHQSKTAVFLPFQCEQHYCCFSSPFHSPFLVFTDASRKICFASFALLMFKSLAGPANICVSVSALIIAAARAQVSTKMNASRTVKDKCLLHRLRLLSSAITTNWCVFIYIKAPLRPRIFFTRVDDSTFEPSPSFHHCQHHHDPGKCCFDLPRNDIYFDLVETTNNLCIQHHHLHA